MAAVIDAIEPQTNGKHPSPAGAASTGAKEASEHATESLVSALQRWRRGRDRAARLDRNLQQYAAAFAAMLGIEAGAEGVFSVAQSVNGARELPPEIQLLLTLGVGFAMAVALLAVAAFFGRRSAEHEADAALNAIIALRPEGFLPEESPE